MLINMKKQIEEYLKLVSIFKSNGFSLFLAGGTVRDFILNLPLFDIDLVTEATPNEIKSFLPEGDYTFSKYGVVKLRIKNIAKFDIVTFRKEYRYIDYRHPSKIKFIKNIKADSKRRDFTINAMYLDERFKLIDFYNGHKDLENKLIRTVGNASKRIKEDPLRILRALRFSLVYGFSLDDQLIKAIKKYSFLLTKINSEKIKEELGKIHNCDENIKVTLFSDFGLKYLLDMIN